MNAPRSPNARASLPRAARFFPQSPRSVVAPVRRCSQVSYPQDEFRGRPVFQYTPEWLRLGHLPNATKKVVGQASRLSPGRLAPETEEQVVLEKKDRCRFQRFFHGKNSLAAIQKIRPRIGHREIHRSRLGRQLAESLPPSSRQYVGQASWPPP